MCVHPMWLSYHVMRQHVLFFLRKKIDPPTATLHSAEPCANPGFDQHFSRSKSIFDVSGFLLRLNWLYFWLL